jgi:hypothetical protein
MAATLLPEGKQSFTNSVGLPLVGGKLYTYDAGTNTPRPTYQDAAATVPNTNPVILDARGEATVFWSGSYKVVCKDAFDVLIWSVDNVTTPDMLVTALRADLAASAGSSLIGYHSSVGRTVEQQLDMMYYGIANIMDPKFAGGAVVGAGANNTAALNAAASASKYIFVPQGEFEFTGQVNLQVDSNLIGQGKITSRLKYTGTGTAFNLAGGYVNLRDLMVFMAPVAPKYFDVGTRAFYSATVGCTITGDNIRVQGFETLFEGTGYYWKFYNSFFYNSKYAFQNMSANNLSFFGCAFSTGHNFISVAPGAGPVSLFGCSIEAWDGVAIANVFGSSIALTMHGCYIENYPGQAYAGTGLGQFKDAFVTAGDFNTLTFSGNSVQCIGVRRVVYNTNTTNVVTESSGNIFYYEAGAALSSTEHLYVIAGGVSFRANDAVSVVANAGYGTYTTGVSIDANTKNIAGVNPLTGKALTTVWTQITPNANWANTGTVGFPTLACKVENGLLYLQGQVGCSSVAGTTIGTLPAAILTKLNCSSAYLQGIISKTDDTAGAKRYRVLVGTGNILVDNPTVGQWDIVSTPWPINS